MIERPILGRLTQGCIFTCATAENYSECAVYGFVITARCDVEQAKSTVLNYLPIVPLASWLEVDGSDILLSRLAADGAGALKNAMDEAKIPEALLLSQTAEGIAESIAASDADKAVKRAALRFLELWNNKLELERLGSEKLAKEIFDVNAKSSAKLIKELVTQSLSGYYFLPSVASPGDDDGYVILLREVKHLGWDLSRLVAGGLGPEEGDGHLGTSELSFRHTNFAEPVGELRSPHVEHVMQCFSSLFGRIGLPDTPKAYIERMCARRPATGSRTTQ